MGLKIVFFQIQLRLLIVNSARVRLDLNFVLTTIVNTVLPRSNLTHAVRSRFVRFAVTVRAVSGRGSCGSRLRFMRFLS